MTRRHKRIADWSDEREQGNSLIVGLVPGYRFDYDPVGQPCHDSGFDTAAEAMTAVRQAVPCHCVDCVGHREP